MADLRLPSINRVMLVGRITKDPDLGYTQDGKAILKFSIAVSQKYKDAQDNWKETVSFIPIISWGPNAETTAERINKGNAVLVEGKIESRSWETSEGQKRTTIQVNAFRIQNLQKPEKEQVEEQEPPPETDEEKQKKDQMDDLPF